MASWLDARAQKGRWIVRIEDLDGPREVVGSADGILATLRDFGFHWDGPVVRQSARSALYLRAFEALQAAGLVYPCCCTRREIEDSASAPDRAHGIYPGTCRAGLPAGRVARAWRMRVPAGDAIVVDRTAGAVRQDLARDVGDFVVRRADGLWAYQLAVVVDDADQGVTDIVRGADLLDSTPRQRFLQAALGLPQPRSMHVPLVLDADGHKLSKGHGAEPLDRAEPLLALAAAARHLGLDVAPAGDLPSFWEAATASWAARWLPRS